MRNWTRVAPLLTVVLGLAVLGVAGPLVVDRTEAQANVTGPTHRSPKLRDVRYVDPTTRFSSPRRFEQLRDFLDREP